MANNSRTNLGIGRGRGRARGFTPDATSQHPHIDPDSNFATTSNESLGNRSPVSQGDVSPYDPGAGGDTLKNSRLSVDANEFYPRNYISYSSKVSDDVPTTPQKPKKIGIMPDDMVCCQLAEIVNSITVEPGTYKSAIKPFLDSYGSDFTDPCTLTNMLDIVIEQSIMEPNFRYNGARFCNDLIGFLANSKPDFRTFLLDRCKKESDLVLECFDSNPIRLQGFVCFLAELYIQLELRLGTRLRIKVLGDGLYELLRVLLTVPVPDNIKCFCMTLKLAGYALDEDNSEAMDALLQSLRNTTLPTSASTNVAALVASIQQLRQTSWGTNDMAEPTMAATNFFQQVAVEDTEPVFYGPDGKVLTPEESAFLQESITFDGDYPEDLWFNGNNFEYECDGEMNDEEEAAYEEFLKMSERNKQK